LFHHSALADGGTASSASALTGKGDGRDCSLAVLDGGCCVVLDDIEAVANSELRTANTPTM
jgi:hypothetical protein